MLQACSVPFRRDVILNRETEAILGIASPLKPILTICDRSENADNLLVACACNANSRSSLCIPCPLSRTRIKLIPASSISISIFVAAASILFSINSFTTEAGRSITSPAAIWFATETGSLWIRGKLLLSDMCRMIRQVLPTR